MHISIHRLCYHPHPLVRGLPSAQAGLTSPPHHEMESPGDTEISRLTELALSRVVFTLLLAVAAFVGGTAAANRLNMEMMPELNFPVVTTMVVYPGASPQDVVDQVTKPVEQGVANVAGIKTLQSTSAEGISVVVAQFEFGTDTKQAEADIQAALSRVSLPANAQPPRTARVNLNDLPVMQISLTGQGSLSDLRRIATDQLVPELSKVNGVYSVELLGGEQQEVQVVLDPEKMAQKGVSFQQVASLLQANNLSLPAGSVDAGQLSVPVRTTHRFRTTEELRNLVVGMDRSAAGASLAAGAPSMPPAVSASPGGVAQTAPTSPAAPPLGEQGPAGGSPARPPSAAQLPDSSSAPPQAAPAPNAPAARQHTVQPGDTVWDLAQRYGTTVDDIAAANHLADPNLIHPNEQLVIPQKQPQERTRPAGGLPSLSVNVAHQAASDPEPPWVKLGDIATVTVGPSSSGGISRTNGKPSILMMVSKTQDANTVRVATAVSKKLNDLKSNLGEGVEVQTVDDESQYVVRSLQGLGREGLLGMVFAVLVIFAFLQTIRGTLIAAASIPLSITLAFLPMAWQGLTLNIMTMAGLAVAVGRVVDDSIVVLENSYRHVQAGQTPAEAARSSTAEVAMPVAASTITTVAVFLPLGMVGGIVGQAFRPFALTVTAALLASLLVALTVVPVLCRLFLPPRRNSPEAGSPGIPGEERPLGALDLLEDPRTPALGAPDGTEDGHGGGNGVQTDRSLGHWLLRLYTPVLRAALQHPVPTLLLSLLLLAGSLSLAPRIPTSFLPSDSQKVLMIQVNPSPGASRDAVSRKAAQVEQILAGLPEVELYHTSIGDDTGTLGSLRTALSGRGSGGATLLVRLGDKADLVATASALRQEVETIQGDSRISVTDQQSAGSSRMQLVVSGDDPGKVQSAATELQTEMEDIPGLVNVSSDSANASTQISIQVDPNRAAELGLTTAQVGSAIRGLITGQVAGRLEPQGDSPMDIRLTVPADTVNSPEKLGKLPFGTTKSLPLSDIARIQQDTLPVQITRVGQSPAVDISGDIVAADAGAVSREIQQRVNALSLPAGVSVEYGGVMQQMSEGFSSMAIGQVVGIGLVYLTMALFFNSLLDPLVILISLPLAAVGVLPALYLTGRTLSMSGMIGMLMLIGIVVTNAIVLLEFARRAIRDGREPAHALLEAGRVRLRPILMTALVTILALAPLALGFESGSIIASDLAIVVMGGLISSTLLTLVVMPSVYRLVRR